MMEQLETYAYNNHEPNTVVVASSVNNIETTLLSNYDLNKSYLTLEPCSSIQTVDEDIIQKCFQLSYNYLPASSEVIHPSQPFETFFEPLTTQPRNDVEIIDIKSNNGLQKRRGRKPKNINTPTRLENKLNRNSNKSYINYKGMEVEPKQFIDHKCRCGKKCDSRLSSVERLSEFEKFWALSSYDAQIAFIAAKVTEHQVKRRYGKTNAIKKDFSRTYTLCSTSVCKVMFCKTLQISSGRINTALTKIRARTTVTDQRGVKKCPALKSSSEKSPPVAKETLITSSNIKDGTYDINVEDLCGTQVTNFDRVGGCFQLKTTANIEKSPVMSTSPTKPCTTEIVSTINNKMTSKLQSLQNANIINYKDFAEKTEKNPICDIPQQIHNKPSLKNYSSKKGRKTKYDQNRLVNKVNRNSNKVHFNHKGELIEPKEFINYNCNCSKKCFLIIPVHNRFSEFEKFWALSYNSQMAYIVAVVSEKPVKRRYSIKNESKKDFTRKYAIGSIPVCRDMFCKTLNISPGRINTALKKYRLKADLTDQRGVKQGGHNKLPTEKRNCIAKFLKKIPIYKSHHSKENPKMRFLPPHMTPSKLYELYKEEEKDKAVSSTSFRTICYNYFNLRNKESCQNCDLLNSAFQKEQNTNKKIKLKIMHDEHNAFAVEAQKYFEYDMLMAKKYIDVECLAFDMEKPLQLPRIPCKTMYYKRHMWLYNFCIYSSKKDQSYCYIWPESTAGKGAQEVGSCLLKHAKEEIIWSSDICHLILWTDPRFGLTRNMRLTLMLKSLMQTCPTLKTIKLRYLLSGHNSLPNQRDFSDIEKTLRNQTNIYTPEEYMNFMKYCRKKKPLIVKSINTTDFFSTNQLEKHINAMQSFNKDVNWAEVCEISIFANDPYNVYFKKQFEGENFRMDIRPKLNGQIINFIHLLVPLWPLGKQIPAFKYKDLNSILQMIPTHAKSFYTNLQCGTNNEDDVDGLNDELDFQIEYSDSFRKELRLH